MAGNRVLHDEFVHVLKAVYKRLVGGLGEPIESYERERLVDLFGLYALYRRLFRTTVKPDKKLFKTLWEVQKKSGPPFSPLPLSLLPLHSSGMMLCELQSASGGAVRPSGVDDRRFSDGVLRCAEYRRSVT